jgi:hypothetical protein
LQLLEKIRFLEKHGLRADPNENVDKPQQMREKEFDGDFEDNPMADILNEIKVDPLKHRSGMYLRWDPNDPATALQGERAWTDLMEKFNKLSMMNAEGAAEQMMLMVEFEGGKNSWEVRRCRPG